MGRTPAPPDLQLPPHSVEAEQALLGAAMLDNRLAANLEIAGSDFYRDNHRRIWTHLCALVARGDLADVVTLSDSLERAGEAEQVGGLSYLATIANGVASVAAAPSYARIVRESAEKRRLQAVWYESARAAGNGVDIDTLVALTNDRVKQARAGTARPLTPPMDWGTLEPRTAPSRDWLIEDWLGAGQPTLLAGPGGSGKSLIAQQLGSCAAVQHPFVGAIPRPLKVLMWMCEDDHDELWRRQVAISHWLQLPLTAFTNLTIVPRLGLDNTLLTTEFGKPIWTPLLKELREQCHDLDADIWVGDNIGQMYGGSENERHPVTMFVNGVTGVVGKATPVFIGHPSKASGSEFSGSTAWENSMRMRWWFSSKMPGDHPQAEGDAGDADEADTPQRYLCKRKTNYSVPEVSQFRFEAGVFAPMAAQNSESDALLHIQAERLVIHAIDKLNSMGINSSEKHAGNYLPKLMAQYALNEGVPKHILIRALARLMIDGKVVKAAFGKDNARRNTFGLKTV